MFTSGPRLTAGATSAPPLALDCQDTSSRRLQGRRLCSPAPALGFWRGLWKYGGCPDTHTVLVCYQCRACHDADAEKGEGAVMMWVTARE